MEQPARRSIWTNLTSRFPGEARVPRPAAPLDIGCGTLIPVRWSNLVVVYEYHHNALGSPHRVEDKPFEMHVIVQTTRGRWDFHGKTGVEEVDASVLVAGLHGDRYGCRHDQHFEDSNIIVSLRPNALDEDDDPLFSQQTLPITVTPLIQRAIRAEDLDALDSRIFEVFDTVSAHSLRPTRQARRNRLRTQRAKRFIEHHAYENVTLADVAACVGVSPFVCLRQFQANTGETPHAYLSRLRLSRAQQLLKKTKLAVGAVASSVGMRDQCYFARWFAKETGMPPNQFRKLST